MDISALEQARAQYRLVLESNTCFDLAPSSGKIVVLEVQLLVKKAFLALVSNGVRSAPLWDSKRMEFVGMLTVTDFMSMLCKFYKSSLVAIDELEQHKIQTWRELAKKSGLPSKVVSTEPEASVLDATQILIQKKIHRLPIISSESNTAVMILTHKRILSFLTTQHNLIYRKPPQIFFEFSIGDLNIGTYNSIITAQPSQPLISVLNLLLEKRISAVPIVDQDGTVIDVYSKFDVINLAREKTYNDLDITVSKALSYRLGVFEGVHTCKKTDSLAFVLDAIVRAAVHRLIVVDGSNHVVGMISLSDILGFLIKPTATIA